MPPDLTKIWGHLETCGYGEFAKGLLNTTSRPVTAQGEWALQFHSRTAAARLRRLLYQLFSYYPRQKARISMKLENDGYLDVLKIRLVDKEERRGVTKGRTKRRLK